MHRRSAGSVHDPEDLSEDVEIVPADMESDTSDRLYGCLFSRVPRPIENLADRAHPALHHSILDLQCDPHDRVDSAPWPEPSGTHGPRASSIRLAAVGVTS